MRWAQAQHTQVPMDWIQVPNLVSMDSSYAFLELSRPC